MNRIFYYELKRLLFNKIYIGAFIVNGVLAWYLLTRDIIAGIAYTAPFSAWSFGAYLGKIMPFCVLTILFLLSFYYSKKQKSVETLTAQTPVTPGQFLVIRSAVLLVCFVLLCALVIGVSIVFYIRFFGFYPVLDFLLPAVLVLFPCFVFTVGIGLFAGRMHQALLYFLMIAAFILGVSDIRVFLDFFGTGYFANEPLSMPVNASGEPDFHISLSFFLARLFYFAGGIILTVISISLSGKKERRA